MIIRTIGRLGDIVYAMAAMRGHYLLSGDKCIVRLQEFFDANHGNHFRKQQQDAIAPLLQSQPYVEGCEYWPEGIAKSNVNLGTWLEYRRVNLENLARSLCHYIKVDEAYAAEKWLEIEAPVNDLTVVSVTSHWDSINREAFWRSLSDRIPGDAVFIGTDKEHAAFQALVRRSFRRQQVSDLHEAAKAIAGCREFFGNQSPLLAIAHSLGKPVTVEVYDERPDCIFLRANAQYPGTPGYILERWGVRCTY